MQVSFMCRQYNLKVWLQVDVSNVLIYHVFVRLTHFLCNNSSVVLSLFVCLIVFYYVSLSHRWYFPSLTNLTNLYLKKKCAWQKSSMMHDPPGNQGSFWLSLSRVRLFATPWTAAHQASLSITNSRSFLKLMSIKSVMPSNHLILCHPLLILPSIFPRIRLFSNESALHIRWLKSRRY